MNSEDKVLKAADDFNEIIQTEAQKTAEKNKNARKQVEYVTAVSEGTKLIKATNDRLRVIEEKSECGTVKVLDHVANWIESISVSLHNLAVWVRSKTTKINAPCAIKFQKK